MAKLVKLTFVFLAIHFCAREINISMCFASTYAMKCGTSRDKTQMESVRNGPGQKLFFVEKVSETESARKSQNRKVSELKVSEKTKPESVSILGWHYKKLDFL